MCLRLTALLISFIWGSILLTARPVSDSTGNEPEALYKKVQSMSRQDFLDAYRQTQKRVPDRFNDYLKNALKSGQTDTKPSDKTLKTNNSVITQHQALPEKMIFPGEFEEVQAVLVTWPYLTFTETGRRIERVFKDIGALYFNKKTQKYDTFPVYSYIDTFPNSPLPDVFSKVIHAIDQNAGVWINVWDGNDSNIIKRFMAERSMPLQNARFFVSQGNSYWYRDCGPIAFYYGSQDSIGFLDFQYYCGRPLDDSLPIHIARSEGFPVFTSTISYEGGNILVDGNGNLFSSEVVYLANHLDCGQDSIDSQGNVYKTEKYPLSDPDTYDSLSRLFKARSVRILPMLMEDGGTGHVDLYVDMFDENNFVLAKYPDSMDGFMDYSIISDNGDSLVSIPRPFGRRYMKSRIPLPKKDDGSWYFGPIEFLKYIRSYSNHLIVNKSIIQPVFADDTSGDKAGMAEDLEIIRTRYPGYNIIPVDVRAFDGFGGAIHCITKQIPADNPVRIMHYPVRSSQLAQPSYKVNAAITNKSGIKSAVIHWRYTGQENWLEAPLASQESDFPRFSGKIVNDSSHGSIEYYISAETNNGKTMTKPITAPKGFYRFNINEPVSTWDNAVSGEYSGMMFPNPFEVETRLIINAKVKVVNAELKIFDTIGNTKLSMQGINGNEIIIKRGNLEAGLYFYQLKSSLGIISSGKIMVGY